MFGDLVSQRRIRTQAVQRINEAVIIGFEKSLNAIVDEFVGSGVFKCHHGMRSRNAAELFLRKGFRKVYNLDGGIDAWSLKIDPTVPRY